MELHHLHAAFKYTGSAGICSGVTLAAGLLVWFHLNACAVGCCLRGVLISLGLLGLSFEVQTLEWCERHKTLQRCKRLELARDIWQLFSLEACIAQTHLEPSGWLLLLGSVAGSAPCIVADVLHAGRI
jgi:hypothetical protein